MLQTLRLHPDSVCSAVSSIEVDVVRPRAGCLTLAYLVTGRIGDLGMPAPAIAARTDDLWRRTCFEAFIRNSPGAAYYEFNFAPSTQWAAYGFAGYRNGKREASEIKPPRIAVEASSERYLLQASLELDRILPPVGGSGGGADGAVASRALGGDRRGQWQSIILGLGASAGKAGFPSSRLLGT